LSVDAPFNTLSHISPDISIAHIHRVIFLCVLIRWIFISAIPTIQPINAVLERVNIIASIRKLIAVILIIAILFAVNSVFMFFTFCLKNNSMIGKNAMRKYP
jgi:hypothetical protein